MGVNFELAVRAEYATMHLMHEHGISDQPVELCLVLGYDLMLEEPLKWEAIQKAYEMDIARCLKKRVGNRRGFKYRKLPQEAK